MNEVNLSVTAEHTDQRLDQALAALLPNYSRTRVQDWIKHGQILVNKQIVRSNYRVKLGDLLFIQIPEFHQSEVEPEKIPLDIRYEDEHLLIVNKDRGMVVHPGAGHSKGTLVNALLSYCGQNLSGIGGALRPGIVHRLDKDTSGLLIVAKDDDTHRLLSEQLEQRQVKRLYTAFVHGVIDHNKGVIDFPIGRDTQDRQRMAVVKGGKPAVTRFVVEERFSSVTQLECQLETGRTHQIRVHMKKIGFPLVGDPIYGPKKADQFGMTGQALHAKELTFFHPHLKKSITVRAELPNDMTKLIQVLSLQ